MQRPGPSRTRRRLLGQLARAAGLFATSPAWLAVLPGCGPDAPAVRDAAPPRDAAETGPGDRAPGAPAPAVSACTDVEAARARLAPLADRIREIDPPRAEALERAALDELGRADVDAMDAPGRADACARLLARDRVARELAAGRVIFVDGWLLAHCEVAAALILTAAATRDRGRAAGDRAAAPGRAAG